MLEQLFSLFLSSLPSLLISLFLYFLVLSILLFSYKLYVQLSGGVGLTESEKRTMLEKMENITYNNAKNCIFDFLSIPAEFIKELAKQREKKSMSGFVDWKFENWKEKYCKEYNREFEFAIKLVYKNKEILIPQILIFDNTKKKLELSQIMLKIKENSFVLDEKEEKLTNVFFDKLREYLIKYVNHSDGKNLRLTNIKETENIKKIEFELQYVRYDNYVHTNLILDAKKKEGDKTLRERIHSDGKLEELNDSKLANNLGINFLFLTKDGFLVLQKRSANVAFRCGEFFPSSSGTVDYRDFCGEQTKTFEKMSYLRETFEELGIDDDIKNYEKVVFLGITRELIRGGEPEMFFFAETKYSKKHFGKECKVAEDKHEYKNLMFFNFGKIGKEALVTKDKRQEFFSKVDEFFDKYLKNSVDGEHVTLKTNLALWIRYRLEETNN